MKILPAPTLSKSSHARYGSNWSVAVHLLLGVWALGCSGDREGDVTTGVPRDLEGRLEVVIVEGPAGGSRYFVVPDDPAADVVELAFERAPDATSGMRIAVDGHYDGDKFVVSGLDFSDARRGPIGRISRALEGVTPERTHTIGFMMVDYGDGINLMESAIQQFMFGTTNPGPTLGIRAGDKSTLQFYDETSYGLFGISGGVEGPLSWTGGAACNSAGDGELVRQLRSQVSTEYDHYIWYYGSQQSECEYGWGSLGTWDMPSRDVWFNGDLFDGAVTHEIGHNLGYQHASSIRCNGVPLADDPMTCMTTEYGSEVSIMGNLANGHMMALEKWYAGWFDGCNAVRVRASGSFNLLPIETACDGVQALQIPMPVTTRTFDTQQSGRPSPAVYYYLEYRNGTGLDTGMTPSVIVVASDDIAPPNRTCARSVQLDMNPSTQRLDGMTEGETYTDPAGGLSFTVTSLTSSLATVSVTMDVPAMPNTCMDDTPLSGSGPDACTGAGDGTGGTGGTGDGGAGGSAGSTTIGTVSTTTIGGAGGSGTSSSTDGDVTASNTTSSTTGSTSSSVTSSNTTSGGNPLPNSSSASSSTVGSSSTSTATATSGDSGTTAAAPAKQGDESGCACSLGSRSTRGEFGIALAMAGLGVYRSRRRRSAC